MQKVISMMKNNIGGLDTMNFDQFVETLKNEVKQLVGAEYSVSVNCVMKVNRELQGLNIRYKDSVVSPSIYLEDYFQEYQLGKDIEKIAEEIIGISKYRKLNVDVITEGIQNYEWVKPRLRMKLINYDKNLKMLQTVPHERILDLAVVPYILLSKGEEMMSVTISNKLLDGWDISMEEILIQAKENTLNLEPVVVEKMSDFIFNLILKDLNNVAVSGEENDFDVVMKSCLDDNKDGYEMYILTNQNNRLGAFAAFQTDCLSGLADKIGVQKLYLLPSSIHECIVLSADNIYPDKLREMIISVNNTEVSENEFLSDTLYQYNKLENQIKIA